MSLLRIFWPDIDRSLFREYLVRDAMHAGICSLPWTGKACYHSGPEGCELKPNLWHKSINCHRFKYKRATYLKQIWSQWFLIFTNIVLLPVFTGFFTALIIQGTSAFQEILAAFDCFHFITVSISHMGVYLGGRRSHISLYGCKKLKPGQVTDSNMESWY